MSVAVVFTPASMSADQYDEITRRLEEAGAGAPRGRLYHVCHGSSDQVHVLDVWDSMESFEEFGKTLMPIIQEMGLDAAEPEFREVHNIIEG